MCRFFQRYLFGHSWESTNSDLSRRHLQNLPIFNWSPQRWIAWHRTTFLKEKEKWKREQNEELCWMVEGKGWSWRSWRSRAGQQAHILEKCRRKCVGRPTHCLIHVVSHERILGGMLKLHQKFPPFRLGKVMTVGPPRVGVVQDILSDFLPAIVQWTSETAKKRSASLEHRYCKKRQLKLSSTLTWERKRVDERGEEQWNRVTTVVYYESIKRVLKR
jgi:hypothetical protein